MEQYGLDLESVHSSPGEDDWVTEPGFEADGLKPPPELPLIGCILKEFFHVQAFSSVQLRDSKFVVSIQIFGLRHHVEIARWIYVYLSGIFQDLWTAHRVRTKARKRQQGAYFYGLSIAIVSRLRLEMRQEQTQAEGSGRDLVRVDDRLRKAFDAAHPDMGKARKPGYRDRTTFAAGMEDGQGINLSKPLADNQTKAIGGGR